MPERVAYITQAPCETVPLSDFEMDIGRLQDESSVSNQSLIMAAAATARAYSDLFQRNTQAALEYVGDPLTSTATSFQAFSRAYEKECSAVGIPADDADSHRPIMQQAYAGFAATIQATLQRNQSRLTSLTEVSTAPDVLRAEAVLAAIAKANQARQDTRLFKKIGSTLSNNLFSKRSLEQVPPKAEVLLRPYVQTAAIYYAKLVYGETRFIAARDPAVLYDAFQARSAPAYPTRPRLPYEIAITRTRHAVNSMLYSQTSPLNPIFDDHGTDSQRAWRNQRRSTIYNRAAADNS